VGGEVVVALARVAGRVVEDERGGGGHAGRPGIDGVRAAQARDVPSAAAKSSRSSASSARSGEGARVTSVDGQGALERRARRGDVVALDERDARQPDVGVGFCASTAARRGTTPRPRAGVLLDEHRAPVEVGVDRARVGAHGGAKRLVGVLPVVVEAHGCRDRQRSAGRDLSTRWALQSP
jgi:hypothetical protein